MVTIALRWLVILLPLAFLAGPTPPEVIIGLVGVAFLVRSVRLRDWQWLRAPWVILFGLLWLHFMLTGAFSEHPGDAIWRGGWWARYPLFVIALSHWLLRGEDRAQRRLLAVLLAVVAFVTGDMLLQFFHGHDVVGYSVDEMGSFVRLTGPFGQPRAGIMLLYLGFPAIFYLFALALEKRNLLLGLAGAALGLAFTLAIYLSGERMALLLCLLGLGVSVLIVKRARVLCLGAAALCVLVLVGLAVVKPDLQERQVRQTMNDVMHFGDSSYGRIWISALAVGRQHPLTGVGLKNFRQVCPRAAYGTTDPQGVLKRCGTHTHNLYLELFAEAGYPAVILFVMGATLWLLRCWQARGTVQGDLILAGLVVALVVRLWPIAAVTSQFNPWAAAPFWLFTGLLLARLPRTDAA